MLRINATTVSVISILVAPMAAFAGAFSDDFQSYTIGTFPSANWQDTALISPFGATPPPISSCTVEVVPDAFGVPTKALQLGPGWVGSASGIYRPVQSSSNYTLSMDVMVEGFASGATDNPSDWPWMFGVSKLDANEQAGGWHSLQMYSTDLSHDFRNYAINDAGQQDFPLGVAIQVGDWYHIEMNIDADAGTIHSRITDIFLGTQLLDTTINVPGWLPSDNVFDVVTINQGELSATLDSGFAWVDNVNITLVPEPASLALLGFGALLFRRKC